MGPDYMIADLARHITLLPGDLILTGTPCHSRPLNPGDELTLDISELGRLTVTIDDARAAPMSGIHPWTRPKRVASPSVRTCACPTR